MSILSLLVDRATIRRATRTASGAGDIALAWADAATDVPCRLEALDAREAQRDGGATLVTRLRATFPGGTDLRPKTEDAAADLVVVDAVAYRVAGVRDAPVRGGRLCVAVLERLD